MAQSITSDTKRSESGSVEKQTSVQVLEEPKVETEFVVFRSYKRRWIGMVALMLLAGVSGMVPWFGPIANDLSDEFGFSLNQINWFSITLNFVYLPVSILVPIFLKKYGTRVTCYIGAVFMLLGAWVRYAGTPHSLSKRGAYALLMLGQIFGAIAQPIFQVLGPKYSEDWFNLKERTTVTMLVSVANPLGGAIAQILSPAFSTTRISILYLGVISTAVLPFVFLIGEKPPTPPTYSASMHPLSFFSLARAMLGREPAASPAHMTVRERVDFAIVALEFGVLVGVITAFSFLTAQFFEPYGYSEDTAGLFGATLLLVGLVAGFITSPLYDRILTHHLALTCKILCPIVSATWLSLIWAVRSNNTIALYVLMGIIGGTSITLLPVALELAAELTRNADGSSAVLWLTANFFGALYILINGALRAGADANPPLNMHRALIFQGTVICVCTVSVVFLTGKQVRRERDELKAKESEGISASGSA